MDPPTDPTPNADPPADPPKEPVPQADPPPDPPTDPTPNADPPADPPKEPAPQADPPTDPPKEPETPKGPPPELINAELKAAAALAGVPKEKIPYVMRLAEVKGADAEGADLGKLAEETIGKVLADIPELAGMQSGTGSTGNFRRATKTVKDAFERGFDGE